MAWTGVVSGDEEALAGSRWIANPVPPHLAPRSCSGSAGTARPRPMALRFGSATLDRGPCLAGAVAWAPCGAGRPGSVAVALPFVQWRIALLRREGEPCPQGCDPAGEGRWCKDRFEPADPPPPALGADRDRDRSTIEGCPVFKEAFLQEDDEIPRNAPYSRLCASRTSTATSMTCFPSRSPSRSSASAASGGTKNRSARLGYRWRRIPPDGNGLL